MMCRSAAARRAPAAKMQAYATLMLFAMRLLIRISNPAKLIGKLKQGASVQGFKNFPLFFFAYESPLARVRRAQYTVTV